MNVIPNPTSRVHIIKRTKEGAVALIVTQSTERPYCVRHKGEDKHFEFRHEAYTYLAQQGWLDLSTRNMRLLAYFEAQGLPYGADHIDGEPVVYRRGKAFDVEISQGRNSPFIVYIWSLGDTGYPQQIVRKHSVSSRDITAAAQEIDRLVEDYMEEACGAYEN